MNILLTNDDGIDARGIYFLAKAFINSGNIIISAPDKQRSACSHSITMNEPIKIKKIDFYDTGIKAYAVSGTPVDCVKLACDKLSKENIDVIISGINHGGNLGTDVLYSGTVSAAIEGAILSIPSIAVSLTGIYEDEYFETAAYYAKYIFDKCIHKDIDMGMVLNVNVPSCSRDEIKGIIATCLGTRRYVNTFEEKVDSSGSSSYLLGGEIEETQNGDTTDVYAVENSCVSVTPMHFELTRFDLLDKINDYINK